MCDRFVTPEASTAEREFGVAHPWWKFSPSFNVHPSRNVPVVRMHADETEGVMLHWGLIPDWAEGDDARRAPTMVESCALVTVPPNPLIAEVQGALAQMPAILDRRDYAAWLTGSSAAAKLMLRSCPQEQMVAHPVSPRVNSLKYDDAQLIRPVEIEARGGLRA